MTEQQNSHQLLKESGKSSASDREITQGDLSKDAGMKKLYTVQGVMYRRIPLCPFIKQTLLCIQ